EAYRDIAGARPPLGLQKRALAGLQHEIEGTSRLAQSANCALQLRGAARREPPAERHESGAILRRIPGSQRAHEIRFPLVTEPDQDTLVAQVEKGFGALERVVELGHAAAKLDVFGCRAATFP